MSQKEVIRWPLPPSLLLIDLIIAQKEASMEWDFSRAFPELTCPTVAQFSSIPCPA